MSHKPRIVLPGLPHHLSIHGPWQKAIFRTQDDRWSFLHLLKRAVEAHGVGVLGYSLLTEHLHLTLRPPDGPALAKVCHKVFGGYAHLFNSQYNWIGHVWMSQYHSCPVAEAFFPRALRVDELNPVRAELAAHPEEYLWSSAGAHLTGEDPTGLLDLDAWQAQWSPGAWASFLSAAEAQDDVLPLRISTRCGRPWGDAAFCARVEAELGRPLPGSQRYVWGNAADAMEEDAGVARHPGEGE
jgi:putative transposase